MKYKVMSIATICQTVSIFSTIRMTLSMNCTAYEVSNIAILGCTQWKWWRWMTDFYGGTLADYIRYCDDRYSGKFKLKKHEDIFDGFSRWLKTKR